MSIDAANGRVGIGTSNPAVKFDVNGTAHVGGKGILQVKGIGTHGYISTDTDTPTTKDSGYIWQYGGTAKWYAYVGEGSTDLQWLSENNSTITFQDATGNLGLGTTSPTSLLSLSSSATTTAQLGTTSSTQGSCFQLYSPNHTAYRAYISNAGAWTVQAGTCE